MGVISIGLALFPIVRLLRFLASSGADLPSNDEYVFVSLVDRMLEGNYAWSQFFKDTVYGAHAQPLVALFYWFTGRFLGWNEYFLVYFGVFLGFCKLILTFLLFTYRNKSVWKWLLLPVLSFLIFSPSQISAYGWGLSSIQYGINQMGLLLGLLGLQRWQGRWTSVVLMVLGIFMGAWTYANGLAYPVFFILGMVWLGYKKRSQYAVVILSGIVTAIPYCLYLNRAQEEAPAAVEPLWVIFRSRLEVFFEGLGLVFPMSQGPSGSWLPGFYGLMLLGIAAAVLWRFYRDLPKHTLLPVVFLTLYSLVTWMLICVFRGHLTMLYNAVTLPFWLGLLGFWVVSWRHISWGARLLGLASLSPLPWLYLLTNKDFSSQAMYLDARAPASAECLRRFREAPTYCERRIFQWYLGDYRRLVELGKIMEKRHWSVFSKHEEWSLQGSFLLPDVRVEEHPESLPVFWGFQGTSDRVVPTNHRKLDLFLHSPNSVEWKLKLPPDLKNAVFHSAVGMSRSLQENSQTDGAIAELWVEADGSPPWRLFAKRLSDADRSWAPFQISLNAFIGKEIKLTLKTDPVKGFGHDWVMFRYPFIEIERGDWQPDPQGAVRPANTELSSQGLRLGTPNFYFDLKAPQPAKGISSKGEGRHELLETNPAWELDVPNAEPLHRASLLHFQMKVPRDIFPRTACIDLKVNGSPNYQSAIQVPLLEDDLLHDYSFELRLLELPPGAKITGLRFAPLCNLPLAQPKLIEATAIGVYNPS